MLCIVGVLEKLSFAIEPMPRSPGVEESDVSCSSADATVQTVRKTRPYTPSSTENTTENLQVRRRTFPSSSTLNSSSSALKEENAEMLETLQSENEEGVKRVNDRKESNFSDIAVSENNKESSCDGVEAFTNSSGARKEVEDTGNIINSNISHINPNETRQETALVGDSINAAFSPFFHESYGFTFQSKDPFKLEADNYNDSATASRVETLRGINLLGASFSPRFPCIEPNDGLGVSFDTPNMSHKQNLDDDSKVWEDFTRIINTRTPCKPKQLNFTSNFSSVKKPSFGKELCCKDSTVDGEDKENKLIEAANSIVGKQLCDVVQDSSVGFSSVINSGSESPNFSDDAFANKLQNRSPLQNLNAETNNFALGTENIANVRLNKTSTVSFKSSAASIATPDSVDMETPQRLFDIQLLRSRLAKLKAKFRM